jgi:putative ABC transport system permease protein
MIPLRYNFRSLVERRVTSFMTVLGVALVSMIFVIVFGFIAGLRQALSNAGQNSNWIILARGATSENQSFVPHPSTEILRVRPEIATDSGNHPLLSRESIAGVNISRIKGAKEFAILRGVEPITYEVHPNPRIVEGHWPIRGNGEWVVGRKLIARYPYLSPGTTFHYSHREWKIVGIFSDNDSERESEIWTDIDDLINDRHWDPGGATALHVVLKPGASAEFLSAIKSDGRLSVEAETETEYYAAQTKVVGQLRNLGFIVALALAIGAIFGGMNTMYTAVTRRGREIGVLRVLGFSRGNVLASFVIESALLGLAGGVTGVALSIIVAWATGLTSRSMTVGAMFFSYQPTLGAFAAGIIVATIIGVAGGLMPALRASRMEIVGALREA